MWLCVCVCKSGGVWLGAIFPPLIVETENPLKRFPPGTRCCPSSSPASEPSGFPSRPLGHLSPPPPTSVEPPSERGSLQSRPVTCRGSCMERLACVLSGRCRFLWQITGIPLPTPTLLPLLPALKTKCRMPPLKFDPSGPLVGRGVFSSSHLFKVGKVRFFSPCGRKLG